MIYIDKIERSEDDECTLVYNSVSSALDGISTLGFEELSQIIISLYDYRNLYDIYGIESSNNILIYGDSAGCRFINWYKSLQDKVNIKGTKKLLQLKVIHISEILSPYFSETEEKLCYYFQSYINDAKDGLLCLCIEGLQYFTNRSHLDSLQRRLLTTLLLLLDGFNKVIPNDRNKTVLIIATIDDNQLNIDQSLIRPGRLYNIINI